MALYLFNGDIEGKISSILSVRFGIVVLGLKALLGNFAELVLKSGHDGTP